MKCEICNSKPFDDKEGNTYLEVHHIRKISDGGPDDPKWVIALCPNCHRRAYYAIDANTYNNLMAEKIQQKEKEFESIN